GERDERMVLGHVGRVADPVDARGRGVDEPLDPRPPRDAHERLEAVVVDGAAEPRIELEARVVRDAGEVDDRVDPLGRPPERALVPDISLYQLESRVLRQHLRAEEKEVDHPHLVAPSQQLRYQNRSDVSTTTGHEHRRSARRHRWASAPQMSQSGGWSTMPVRSSGAPLGCSSPTRPWNGRRYGRRASSPPRRTCN